MSAMAKNNVLQDVGGGSLSGYLSKGRRFNIAGDVINSHYNSAVGRSRNWKWTKVVNAYNLKRPRWGEEGLKEAGRWQYRTFRTLTLSAGSAVLAN